MTTQRDRREKSATVPLGSRLDGWEPFSKRAFFSTLAIERAILALWVDPDSPHEITLIPGIPLAEQAWRRTRPLQDVASRFSIEKVTPGAPAWLVNDILEQKYGEEALARAIGHMTTLRRERYVGMSIGQEVLDSGRVRFYEKHESCGYWLPDADVERSIALGHRLIGRPRPELVEVDFDNHELSDVRQFVEQVAAWGCESMSFRSGAIPGERGRTTVGMHTSTITPNPDVRDRVVVLAKRIGGDVREHAMSVPGFAYKTFRELATPWQREELGITWALDASRKHEMAAYWDPINLKLLVQHFRKVPSVSVGWHTPEQPYRTWQPAPLDEPRGGRSMSPATGAISARTGKPNRPEAEHQTPGRRRSTNSAPSRLEATFLPPSRRPASRTEFAALSLLVRKSCLKKVALPEDTRRDRSWASRAFGTSSMPAQRWTTAGSWSSDAYPALPSITSNLARPLPRSGRAAWRKAPCDDSRPGVSADAHIAPRWPTGA